MAEQTRRRARAADKDQQDQPEGTVQAAAENDREQAQAVAAKERGEGGFDGARASGTEGIEAVRGQGGDGDPGSPSGDRPGFVTSPSAPAPDDLALRVAAAPLTAPDRRAAKDQRRRAAQPDPIGHELTVDGQRLVDGDGNPLTLDEAFSGREVGTARRDVYMQVLPRRGTTPLTLLVARENRQVSADRMAQLRLMENYEETREGLAPADQDLRAFEGPNVGGAESTNTGADGQGGGGE